MYSIKANIAQQQLLLSGPYSFNKTTSFLDNGTDEIFDTNPDIRSKEDTQKGVKVSFKNCITMAKAEIKEDVNVTLKDSVTRGNHHQLHLLLNILQLIIEIGLLHFILITSRHAWAILQ
jgi:hypothetical protein